MLKKITLQSLVLLLMLVCVSSTRAQTGYKLQFKFADYANDTLFLGFHFGNQTYFKDTAIYNKSTKSYTFQGKENLKPGVYLIVTPPANDYFQIMMSDSDQQMSLESTVKTPYSTAKLKNAPDNALFFSYMKFIADKRDQVTEAKKDTVNKDRVKDLLAKLDGEVKEFQGEIIKKNPKTTSAKLLKSTVEIDFPKIEDNDPAKNEKMYYYARDHYFDHFDLADPAFVRIPTTFDRVDYYVQKLTPQHPDSIFETVSMLLDRMSPSEETFRFYFIHYLNDYIKSKFVGFDAIHVNLAKKYIETGKTPFLSADSAKLVSQANKLFPLLIGKKAPDVTMFKEDNSKISLYSIKAKYTVFYVWDPDCGHCKKSLPLVVDFIKKWRSKGVEAYFVCSRKPDETSKCWEEVKSRGMEAYINVVDPYMISRYKSLYNVEVTPAMYVLDEDKKIISKGLESNQLDELFNELFKDDKPKN
jgi:peroxiredoxin